MDLPSISTDATAIHSAEPSPNEKSICVIGAGPAGLAALKVIMDTPQYKAGLWKPMVFESRDKAGGVWYPALPTDEPPLTPLYDSLTTNLPHPVMAFTSYSFPPSTPLFPRASVVQKYLESYADHFHLHQHIQLSTTVIAVEYRAPKWSVWISSGETLSFDLVMVCNGHYRIPRYPNTPGIASWLNARKASHSAWYRRPHNLGDTVLVVGAGPSGQDISTEMRTAAKTVIHSFTGALPQDVGNLKRRGRVLSFGENGTVSFEDGSMESGVDYCILATGYEVSFPFLSPPNIIESIPPPVPPLPRELYNSTFNVFPLAKHLFPLQAHFPPTSLVFLGLLVRVAPLPVVEAQARAALRAFADPEALDGTQEAVDIICRYEDIRKQVGDSPLAIAKAWHRFEPHEQFDYRDQLSEFAEAGPTEDGLETSGLGKIRVHEWEREMYDHKGELRSMWVKLEERGEAEDWVRGVGEGGPHEWVDFMRRVLRKAQEEGETGVGEEGDKAKL
ncbi:FAD/NAD(P)-binding domain-containing protein [Crucibulum laeve]|uniref:FAD/NAD(P)-binding domain-containing protein n=1 Tax=Crucibulum laeve TaxID=68775 RepID=A0A5C3LMS7_9AGAR|nr:FAD/NAD(P)-binding domain-containing protein [Crucibulum laeve]